MSEQPQMPKIFFVDDDEAFLESLKRSLHAMRHSWDMTFYTNPAAALPELAKVHSAMIVSDWMMQGMDGLAFCKLIRDAETGQPNLSRYIIVLTGRQNPDDIVRALDDGADDYVTKPFNQRELIARINVGLRILLLQQRLRDANQQLGRLATADPLTGAFNRRQGSEILLSELERVMRDRENLSVLLVDLDNFKHVNDKHGHAAGDAALCAVVGQLKHLCRRYDSVARWGGDEFVVICPHSGPEQSSEIAERLRRSIETMPIKLADGKTFSITISIGATTVPSGCKATISEVLMRADEALYVVKDKGRNQVEHTPWISMDSSTNLLRKDAI